MCISVIYSKITVLTILSLNKQISEKIIILRENKFRFRIKYNYWLKVLRTRRFVISDFNYYIIILLLLLFPWFYTIVIVQI